MPNNTATNSNNTNSYNTTNNYYTTDSHNVTTTTLTNIYSVDSHNTTTNVVNTTTDSHNVDSHDVTNFSLVDGGILNGASLVSGGLLNGSLNGLLSGNSIGDILSGNSLLSPDVDVSPSVGDINLSPSIDVGGVQVGDLVHGVLNPNIANGLSLDGVLSPTLNTAVLNDIVSLDVLDGATTTVGDVLSPATDILSDISILDGATTTVSDVLSPVTSVLSGNSLDVLDDVTATVGDVLSPATNTLSDIGVDNVANIADMANDLDLTGVVANVLNGSPLSIGEIVANIASFDIGGNNLAANLTGVAEGIASGTLLDVAAGQFLSDASLPVDLSDVGAAIALQPVQDLLTTHLDLDQLTSNVNLFDHGSLDLASLLHHS